MLMLLTMVLASAVGIVLPADPPAADPQPLEVAVLSFNIRYGTAADGENAWPERKGQVFEVLRGAGRPDGREEAFDFVGLQEALRPQIDDILAGTEGYKVVGVGRDDGVSKGEHCAILFRADRWACASSGTFWLSDTPEAPGSKTWGNGITRICTWGRFEPASGGLRDEAGGGPVYVFNTHLDHQSQPSRERSAELIAAKVREIAGDRPRILMGDFNSGESNAVVLYLTGRAERAVRAEMGGGPGEAGEGRSKAEPSPGFVDTFRAAHPDERVVGTFNGFDAAKRGGEKIDFILVDTGWRTVRAWIDRRSRDGRAPSDHWAVGAVVRRERDAQGTEELHSR